MEFTVTYLSNSGFLQEIGKTLLIFDYTCDCPQFVNETLFPKFDRVVFFVSHSHYDHFSPDIFAFSRLSNVDYALSYDVYAPCGVKMNPGETIKLNGISVSAFGSTDLGVSFLVETDGIRVFHAGDLNFWHWKTQSSPFEVMQMRRLFTGILDTLPGRFDAAFFPVDPRLERDYDEGAQIFLDRFAPRALFPMHFREAVWAPLAFAEKNKGGNTRVFPLTRSGQKQTVILP